MPTTEPYRKTVPGECCDQPATTNQSGEDAVMNTLTITIEEKVFAALELFRAEAKKETGLDIETADAATSIIRAFLMTRGYIFEGEG